MDRRAAPVFGLCSVQSYARLRRGPSGSASAKDTPARQTQDKKEHRASLPGVLF